MRIGGRRAVVALVVAGLLAVALAASCTSESASAPRAEVDGPVVSTTSSSTTEPAPTTLPARQFEPLLADPALTLEEQVEAAYLFHWEVLSYAGRTGDASVLDLVFADDALELRVKEVQDLVARGVRMGGHVEHRYEVAAFDASRAVVTDAYRDFLSHVDPDTSTELGRNAGDRRLVEFHFTRIGDSWRITDVIRLNLS